MINHGLNIRLIQENVEIIQLLMQNFMIMSRLKLYHQIWWNWDGCMNDMTNKYKYKMLIRIQLVLHTILTFLEAFMHGMIDDAEISMN